jgi:serine/threonine protein kinase
MRGKVGTHLEGNLMGDFDPERDPIDVLAEEFAARCRRGEQPAVSEYTARYPEWAGQLRDVLPPVALMERLKRLRQAPPAEEVQLQRLGDYRILREVGRGGMGIVYEAVQESLGRRVALKVLPRHALLDRKKRDRFQREAQAAARLHHTNIVPVFGVGEHDGLPYYAMQYIDGKGLNEVLADLRQGNPLADTLRTTRPLTPAPPTGPETTDRPTSPEACRDADPPRRPVTDTAHWYAVAGIGVQAAQALHHAHHQGTLHRDVKPANLLLDHQGTLWVTDFGLAKMAPAPADEEGKAGNLTDTGDILGTLQYMAPESFQGQADARSDVYSLGLTLYELLTLQAPFGDGHPARLLKQVSEQEPPRPRKVNPAIPRDLETIILKAIAREPAGRYPTAGALADDLGRFLDDRPIQARRATAGERLWRWCRRNRAVAALTATALAFFVLAAVVGWIGYANTQEALQREEQQGQEARQARHQAEQNVQLAREAFEDIFNTLGQGEHEVAVPGRFGDGPGVPPASAGDAALLKSILQFYDRFAARNATNPGLQKEAARGYRRVGEIYQRWGRFDEAQAAYLQAARLLEKLVAEFPAEARYRYELALTYSMTDPRAQDARSLAEAVGRWRRALALAEDQDKPDAEQVALRARTHAKLAWALEKMQRDPDAEAAYRQAIALYASLPEENHGPHAPVLDLAATRHALANLLLRRGQAQEARTLLEESIARLRAAPRLRRGFRGWPGPLPPPVSNLLAAHYESLADAWKRLGEARRAAAAARKADELKQAFKLFPAGRPPGRGKGNGT